MTVSIHGNNAGTNKSALAAQDSTTAFVPGFARPVYDSQRVFRVVLDAMAHPGRVMEVTAALESPGLLHPAAAAAFLTLADLDTPVWIQPGGSGADYTTAARFLGFHCNCPLTHDAAGASFALIHSPLRMPALASFRLGEADYPDRSTTLLIQVEGFEGNATVRLKGPGILDSQSLAVAGLPSGFWNEWRDNAQLFPRGVDVLFISGDRIAALPRTTRVEG
jgi:alpha-D-ribose 1-methylphosphonate 5-triphosphate synthase subunit PhnH